MKSHFTQWSAGEHAVARRAGHRLERRDDREEPLWKVFLDKVLSVAALFLLAPFIALVAGLLKIGEGGPVIFAHTRIGKNGEPFRCLKFRTMLPDAEERLDAYLASNPEAREEWETHRKLSDDPRVTCLGRFLRKSSLDELPQFWNVLRGDMSIVGPRPITEQEAVHYGNRFGAYLSVRPGITGLWQVIGRSDTTYEERVSLDMQYVRGRSLMMDLRIILRTIVVVFTRNGAR